MTDSANVQAIRARYQASFPQKARELSELQAEPRSGKKLDEQVNALKEYLHKLAGSSGMYGYTDLASACREGMRLCDAADETAIDAQVNRIVELLESKA